MKLKDDKRCLIIKGKEGKDYPTHDSSLTWPRPNQNKENSVNKTTFNAISKVQNTHNLRHPMRQHDNKPVSCLQL